MIGLVAVSTVVYYGAYGYMVWQTVAGLITVGSLTFLAASFQRSRDLIQRVLLEAPFRFARTLLPGMYDRTISVYTFSKTYALTGLRLGYLAARDSKLRERIFLQAPGREGHPADEPVVAATVEKGR